MQWFGLARRLFVVDPHGELSVVPIPGLGGRVVNSDRINIRFNKALPTGLRN